MRGLSPLMCVPINAFGEIRSAWKYEKDGTWEWTFTIPPNTTATVIAPGGTPKEYAPGTHTLHRAEIGLNVL